MSDPLAMFPLGSVLLPGSPMALRVFESRFLAMLAEISADQPPEFGVVLIQRGQEVGGRDVRFDVGTIARLVQVQPADDAVAVIALGGSRVRVLRWLEDDPYPRAEVEVLDDLVWDDSLQEALDKTATVVANARRVLRDDASGLDLSADPLRACWQVADAAPVGPLDRLAMLQVDSVRALLRVVHDTTVQVVHLQEAFDA